MSFSPDHLLNSLRNLSTPSGYLVGFSGGMDSHVLLHALAQLGDRLSAPLRAIHIDHGLQASSSDWHRHCEAVCRDLDIPLVSFSLELKPIKGESLENVARQARYGVLAEQIHRDEMLLTAHHQDDQAETLLLQLLRGAGLSGLAAMPMLSPFDKGMHARPLLDVSRDELLQYATRNHLQWIEDGSNQDTEFDRNYLRHKVIPLLKSRWPATTRTLSRSARHCAEADQLIAGLLSEQLNQIRGQQDGSLSISALNALPTDQQGALLRLWIGQAGFTLPSAAVLKRIISEVLGARPDRNPLVTWSGAEVRRYRDALYLMSPLPAFDSVPSLVWRGESELMLPAGLGRLQFHTGEEGGTGLAASGVCRITFRRGGEICRPLGRGQSKRLKQLLQGAGVFPWMRDRIPLLEIDGEIAEVIGVCRCEPVLRDSLLRRLNITWDCPQPWMGATTVNKPV
ncbi:tRNA lysidine(34) synthetase TilS [Sedimenticola thiotaurini]|uniref:tRNA lysidine(34) synthetase TilS n=1 Tax=Sedimenticola thiotaurini TaxID=1543721 RepID=UPI00069B9217|nr:tRNA lysidine(34) synthetase TilS [Sedimenticola thiotaurini]